MLEAGFDKKSISFYFPGSLTVKLLYTSIASKVNIKFYYIPNVGFLLQAVNFSRILLTLLLKLFTFSSIIAWKAGL